MEPPYKGKTGLRRIWNALHFSLAGLQDAYRHEAAFRQEILLTLCLTPVAFVLEPTAVGRALMVGSLILVLIVELLNSAVEAVVDRISFDHHELAKRAKDIGSAAVLLTLIQSGLIWVMLLWP